MPRGVHYLSYADNSGHGTAGRRAIRGLVDAGVAVRWTPVTWTPGGDEVAHDLSGSPPWLSALAHRDIATEVAVIHTPPGDWGRWRAQIDPVPAVGVAVWETSVLPRRWAQWTAAADRVVVPCRWNADLFEEAGLARPSVVPHCPTDPLPPPPEHRPDGVTTFTTTGDWTARKAVGDTIEAFLRAFSADDPVRLLVKTGTVDCTGRPPPGGGALGLSTAWAITRILARHPRPARVDVITADLDRTAMRSLWAATDCFVSLTRSEGFGLGSFDAATHGRPVIITGWGGHLEVLDPTHTHLVDHTLVPVDDPLAANHLEPGQRWAQASLDHAAALMRSVVEHPAEARRRGAHLARWIAGEHSAERATRRLVEVLDTTIGAGIR